MKTYQQLASAAMLSHRPIGATKKLRATTMWLVALLLTPVLAGADDAVMEWNQIALAATVTEGQGPVPQIRTMAIVQVSCMTR